MTTTKTAPAISNIKGAPDGIVRLFVPTGLDVSKTDLLNAARKIAGTATVGRVPAGKSAKLNGVTGHVFDFAPVRRTSPAAPAAPAVTAADAAVDARIGVLVGMGMTVEQATAIIGTMAPAAPAAPSKAKAPAAPKKDREVPAFLRKWQDVTCKTCRDFGKVRGPGAGDKAGRPFRTQHGADSAPTAIPCTSHTAKAKGKGRKTA